uniref:Probable leucine-rich repeat receptor-like protein kinase IMK3 n=1 Tax=Tanacetum cinerariifolium TaxID=118510 RepID=A0A699IF69_TANCI|nr:probable leucine-rich repeat receptor-like protein kinase IMK3 [Tanacetum cinerariifolium]
MGDPAEAEAVRAGDGGGKLVYFEGKQVAVKRLREGIAKTLKEFQSEVNSLGKIRHENLLAIRAYYLGPKEEKLLVFDYMPNGSLASFLHGFVIKRYGGGGRVWRGKWGPLVVESKEGGSWEDEVYEDLLISICCKCEDLLLNVMVVVGECGEENEVHWWWRVKKVVVGRRRQRSDFKFKKHLKIKGGYGDHYYDKHKKIEDRKLKRGKSKLGSIGRLDFKKSNKRFYKTSDTERTNFS